MWADENTYKVSLKNIPYCNTSGAGGTTAKSVILNSFKKWADYGQIYMKYKDIIDFYRFYEKKGILRDFCGNL